MTSIRLQILTALFLGLMSSNILADHELKNRDIKRGQTLYAEQCASCHGENLEGQPDWRTQNADGTLPAPPHDETGHTWHHNNKLLFSYTKLGGEGALKLQGVDNFKSGMPAFAEILSDDEIWDVLAFIQSTWPKSIQDIQSLRNPPH